MPFGMERLFKMYQYSLYNSGEGEGKKASDSKIGEGFITSSALELSKPSSQFMQTYSNVIRALVWLLMCFDR